MASRSSVNRDRKSLYIRFCRYWSDRRKTRMALQKGPRTLAEALRDSGSLQMPAGEVRFTGSLDRP